MLWFWTAPERHENLNMLGHGYHSADMLGTIQLSQGEKKKAEQQARPVWVAAEPEQQPKPVAVAPVQKKKFEN